jgi:hypothetical protein
MFMLACAPSANGQDSIPYPRANKLSTTVTAIATQLGGDTIRVSHSVFNDQTSQQEAETFVILTSISPLSMITPGMRIGWVPHSGLMTD